MRNLWGNKYPRDLEVIQVLEQLLLQKFAGRPHWGKNDSPMFANVSTKYPRWQEFEEYLLTAKISYGTQSATQDFTVTGAQTELSVATLPAGTAELMTIEF